MFPLGAEISLDVYYDVVCSTMTNLLERGVANLLVTTWHTENGVVIYDAAREAHSRVRTDAKIVALDSPGSLARPETRAAAYVDGPVPGHFEHAGLIETSVMLALQPERVRPFADVEARLPSLPYDVVPAPEGAVSPTGSFTSPRNATAAIGQSFVDDIIVGLARVLDQEFSTRRH